MAVKRPTPVPALDGLAIEAVEWLPSGSDAGLVRVRGRWSDTGRREPELPALLVRRDAESRRFESLPDARFGRDPALWRATYLVPAVLMEPAPDELALAWDSGARALLPAPERGFEPPQAAPPAVADPVEEPGGEVIDRAVMAERRARRAEAAERAQAQRAAEALKAVEVLELRGGELERRLEALQAAEPATSAPEGAGRPADPGASSAAVQERSEPQPGPGLPAANPHAEALTAAVATVKRLRGELGEQRRRLRKSELLRAADAVALASLREQEGRVQLLEQQFAASRGELERALASAEAATAEAHTARAQAAEQVALAQQRAATDAASVRARTADELAAIGDELTRVRSGVASVRRHAAERAAGLERRLSELDSALDAERRARAGAETGLETAQGALAAAAAANDAEAVARAALEEELDRDRAARATLTAALVSARAELAQAHSQLDAARPLRGKLVQAREQARVEAAVAQAELAAARDRAHRAEAELADARVRLRAAHARIAELERAPRSQSGALLDRIAERGQGADSGAREQADLEGQVRARADDDAVPAAPAPVDEPHEFSRNLDAAAAALRARSPREPATAPVGDAGAGTRREHPRLREALIRLAHDDPRTAARLLLALVPVQSALVAAPLEFDLTIHGAGTYAISIDARRAAARPLREPRARDQAAFHVAADVVTLAELLAGVQKRMGRWIGSVKVHGRRRAAEALRDALVGADLDLAAAARAGAELEPDLVWRTLAHAIDPSWTRGHTFTIAQEITDPRPLSWYIAVRDGAPVTVGRRAPAQPPDASVAMSRAAFAVLLRAAPAPAAGRPTVRGDRAAVATLKAWTDRAQGRGA